MKYKIEEREEITGEGKTNTRKRTSFSRNLFNYDRGQFVHVLYVTKNKSPHGSWWMGEDDEGRTRNGFLTDDIFTPYKSVHDRKINQTSFTTLFDKNTTEHCSLSGDLMPAIHGLLYLHVLHQTQDQGNQTR